MYEFKKNLADAIREARTSCGLSQEKLAEAVGLSNHAIIKIESGNGNPKFENLNLQKLTMELSSCSEDEAKELLPAIRYLLNLLRK